MRSITALAGVAAIGLLASACGSPHSKVRTLSVTERDFAIRAPRTVDAGVVRIEVHNRGPVSHELLLVRASGGSLPLRADGFTIDEELLRPRLLAAIEPEGPGTHSEAVVRLRPGRYILFCNMAGHAAAGMQTVLRVR